MKVLVQRVSKAAVRVGGETVAEIGTGLVVLLGVETGDVDRDADYMADKTAELRIFPDGEGRMNLGLEDAGGEAIVVSQFTLAASTRRGRRPSFTGAADPAKAVALYERYVGRLRGRGIRVGTGVFQAHMEVELVNDGPVTILLDPPSIPRSRSGGPPARASREERA